MPRIAGRPVVLARLLTPSDFGVVAAGMVVMVVAWPSARTWGRRRWSSSATSSTDAFLRAALLRQPPPRRGYLRRHGRRCRPTRGRPGTATGCCSHPGAGRGLLLGAVGNMHYALLRRTMQFGRLATINIANAVVNGVVGILLAVAGAGIWALVVGTVAGVVVSTVTAWWYEAWRPWPRSASDDSGRWPASASATSGQTPLAIVFAQLDKVIISRVLGGAALGTYTVAQRTVTSPVNAVSSAVSTVSSRPSRVGRTTRRGCGRA